MSTLCEQFLEHLRREGGVWECDKGHGALQPFNGKPDFTYGAQMRFWTPPQDTKNPVVMTATRSWPMGKKNERGMHYDQGFMKCVPGDNTLEWTIVSNNGAAEYLRGDVSKNDDQKVKTFTALLEPEGTLNLGGANTLRQLEILEPTAAQKERRVSLRHTMHMSVIGGNPDELWEHLTEIYRPVPEADFTYGSAKQF